MEKIRTSQAEDPVCKAMIKKLETKCSKEETSDDPFIRNWIENFEEFCYMDEEGFLRKLWKPYPGKVVHQLIVPLESREVILHDFHSTPVGGHQSAQRTLNNIQEQYFWPGMKREVRLYSDQCITCAKAKGHGKRVVPPLHPVRAPPSPLDQVSMDILKLPMTLKGNQYLLVLVDYKTKYAGMEPMQNQTVKSVAEAYSRITASMGLPKVLSSDQGTQFTSEVFKAYCEMMGTSQNFTTTYHPQGNANTERVNRTIIGRLRTLVSVQCDDWDVLIPFVQLAYNSTIHSTTGDSPYYLMYGRLPNLPSQSPLTVAVNHGAEDEDGVEGLKFRLHRAWQWADKLTKANQDEYKRQFDKKAKISPLKVGDHVLYYDEARRAGKGRKIANLYTGPYVITRIADPNAYIRYVGDNPKIRKKDVEKPVHIDKLSLMNPKMIEKEGKNWDISKPIDVRKEETKSTAQDSKPISTMKTRSQTVKEKTGPDKATVIWDTSTEIREVEKAGKAQEEPTEISGLLGVINLFEKTNSNTRRNRIRSDEGSSVHSEIRKKKEESTRTRFCSGGGM
jgi:hypothetical protein